MKKTTLFSLAVAACAMVVLFAAAAQVDASRQPVEPVITVDGQAFYSWDEYGASEIFRERGRCATPSFEEMEELFGLPEGADSGDCSAGNTNPDPGYDPGDSYVIDVVVHIIMDDACSTGAMPDERVHSQIEILNEDFLALTGTNGENGTDTQIHFQLATVDPGGSPTTGITRSCNTQWYNDGGAYWNSLAWDPNRYMNIYTNSASGALGYVPFLPASSPGQIGTAADRIVVLHSAFGRDAPFVPFDQGRTATHEVGHYLGLYHTFQGACAAATEPQCHTTGDRICDTNSEASPNFGCNTGTQSCGSVDPVENYMDYSDDLCMELFTVYQARRQRCTLQFYRDQLNTLSVFADGFESGDTTAWDSDVQ